MTTVIFVHGISVREPEYTKTFNHVKKELQTRLPGINVLPCSWGDSLGARFRQNGASIPPYGPARNINSELDEKTIRWMQLSLDSFYELRLLSLKPKPEFIVGQEDLGDELDLNLQKLKISSTLKTKLKTAGILDIFSQAHQNVINSTAYREAKETISDTVTEHRDAIARAIIAESISICEQQEISALIRTNSDLRNEIWEDLSGEIYYTEAAPGDWLKEQMIKLCKPKLEKWAHSLTNEGVRQRTLIADFTNPIVGDVIRYQGRGQAIRGLIEDYITEAEPPVVLLAHSLGGIACLDLLVEKHEQLSKVKLLITVGSQAPYFYEINGLHSLEFEEQLPGKNRLPGDFEWLNIYDPKDFLSFFGGKIFPRVQDIPVDNQQFFPRSHSDYWKNNETWMAIVNKIKRL